MPGPIYARFNFHPERCVGCGACVTACLDANSIDLDVQPPLRRVIQRETRAGSKLSLKYYSVACMHCPDAPCAGACPMKCLSRDERVGVTVLDNAACVGCKRCSRACPYQAISFDIGGKARKCSGCRELLAQGRLPVCVAACPRKAITIDEVNDVLESGREKLAKITRVKRARA